MSKLITITLAVILLASCGMNSPVDGTLVREVKYDKYTDDALYTSENGGTFWAPKDMYHVKDTIHFVKR